MFRMTAGEMFNVWNISLPDLRDHSGFPPCSQLCRLCDIIYQNGDREEINDQPSLLRLHTFNTVHPRNRTSMSLLQNDHILHDIFRFQKGSVGKITKTVMFTWMPGRLTGIYPMLRPSEMGRAVTPWGIPPYTKSWGWNLTYKASLYLMSWSSSRR